MSCHVPSFPVNRLTFLQGESFKLEDMKNNNIVVLECWGTYCPPCVSSVPHLSALNDRLGPRGVVFCGVSAEGKGDIEKFIRKMGSKMNYRVAMDTYNEMDQYSRKFNVQGIPHAYIIDHLGFVRWQGHPMEPEMENKLDVIANELRLFKQKIKKSEEDATSIGISMNQLTEDKLFGHSIGDLLWALKANHLDPTQFLEKSEMIQGLIQANKMQEIKIKDKSGKSAAVKKPVEEKKAEPEPAAPASASSSPYECTGDSCPFPPRAKPQAAPSACCSGPTCSPSAAQCGGSIDLPKYSKEELSSKSISELNQIVRRHGIQLPPGGLEKTDIVEAIFKVVQMM